LSLKREKDICAVALEKTPSWAFSDVRIDLFANDITFRRQIENLENLKESGRLALKYSLGDLVPFTIKKN
jgi:hypothetical protein